MAAAVATSNAVTIARLEGQLGRAIDRVEWLEERDPLKQPNLAFNVKMLEEEEGSGKKKKR